MLKKYVYAVLLVVLTVMGVGCGQKQGIEIGSVDENNVYTNKYFKMSMTLPEGWVIASEEELQAVMEQGQEVVEDSGVNKVGLELSKLRTVSLLMATNSDGNGGNFAALAENLVLATHIKTGEDYLNEVKKGLDELKGQVPISVKEGITTTTIGGKEFYVLEATIDGTTAMQTYYCSIINNYALCFIATSVTDDDLMAMTNIMPTVKFE